MPAGIGFGLTSVALILRHVPTMPASTPITVLGLILLTIAWRRKSSTTPEERVWGLGVGFTLPVLVALERNLLARLGLTCKPLVRAAVTIAIAEKDRDQVHARRRAVAGSMDEAERDVLACTAFDESRRSKRHGTRREEAGGHHFMGGPSTEPDRAGTAWLTYAAIRVGPNYPASDPPA